MRKLLAGLIALGLSIAPSLAHTYPSRPIRFVIPFGPGSATDALARIAGEDLSQTLGQPIVVVHKPGADGALAAIDVQRAAPDGYTFLFGTNSPLAVAPNMRKVPQYDVMKDFTPIAFLGENTFFLVVHPSLPVKSVAELISYGKSRPTPLNYAAGNTFALVGAGMWAARNQLTLQAVPYKGEPDAIIDVLSGRVEIMPATATTTIALSATASCAPCPLCSPIAAR